ncbi:MAG: ribonuclease P, partial [Methanomicrobiaceae archaeon]|nr:ribonuclease P [Methanomicrobiaceae archaeon]
MDILFREASEVFPKEPALSDRYVALARRISMRQRVRIPRELQRRFCRKCHAYLVPGVNARVRVHRGRVVTTCLVCGHRRRY